MFVYCCLFEFNLENFPAIMPQYSKYVRITNISIHDRNTEDLIEWIHQLDVGNIFDLVVFRPFENRTTTTANLTLWNRARHDELVEQLNRQQYRNTTIYAKGSHEPYQAGKPIYTATRIPQAADRMHARDAYQEPQQGPHGPTLAAYTERRRTPQQRVHISVTTTTTRRLHIEPVRVNATPESATRRVIRAPVHNRLRHTPYPPAPAPTRPNPVAEEIPPPAADAVALDEEIPPPAADAVALDEEIPPPAADAIVLDDEPWD